VVATCEDVAVSLPALVDRAQLVIASDKIMNARTDTDTSKILLVFMLLTPELSIGFEGCF
jgi:hypothetical protein